jgi:hypothetical protein
MPIFSRVILIVTALTLLSGLLAAAMSIAQSFLPHAPGGDQVLGTFTDEFKMGLAALIGLLGGRGLGGRGA